MAHRRSANLNPDHWIPIGAAARLLHMSNMTVKRYAEGGVLGDPNKVLRFTTGGHWRLNRAAVEQYARRHDQSAQQSRLL